MSELAEKILDCITSRNMVEAKKEIQNLLYQKSELALEQRKEDLAQNLFSEESENLEEGDSFRLRSKLQLKQSKVDRTRAKAKKAIIKSNKLRNKANKLQSNLNKKVEKKVNKIKSQIHD